MIEIDDLQGLLATDTPLIDTRAPIEFARGSLPTAVNLPLMSDAEREQVGTCYQLHGQNAAIELGHQLVQGPIKAERIDAWIRFAQAHPTALYIAFAEVYGLQSLSNGCKKAASNTPE